MTVSPTAIAPERASRDESAAVHAWRVSRLTMLGLPLDIADSVADQVDWHEVARLIRSGCPAALALQIVR